jgi:uncharacterized protein YyaL (SSP411 family)
LTRLHELKGLYKKPNRLVSEKSPYLLQHAYNPVNWYPWGTEAFTEAKKANRPIFLSIGYSTCHWCHIMEEESFEDPEVAVLLNRAFISIKVDREERPDIDNFFMAVCQRISGVGGWPLTIIMTPDINPFFAGTYFPRESRDGRIGLLEILSQIKKMWITRHSEIINLASNITADIQYVEPGSSIGYLGKRRLSQHMNSLSSFLMKSRVDLVFHPSFQCHILCFFYSGTGNVLANHLH